MLLPYYIAALNIEHAYFEQTGSYEAFEGLCFVDTLELAEGQQQTLSFMTEANTARVERQKRTPITVIIGNPPYNVGQLNENDNNKNRSYPIIDGRVKDTYARDSKATSVSKINDPYVKFFRWATDRLQGRDGIVCFVTNNGFLDQIAFDGMRKHLHQDFTRIYHVDLHGNVRKNPKLSGTTHNVFGIQVGVGITVAVRSAKHKDRRLFYFRLPEEMRREEKLNWLTQRATISAIEWQTLAPDRSYNWLVSENAEDYAALLPMGSKEAKVSKSPGTSSIFKTYSIGLSTNRDDWVYDFDTLALQDKLHRFIETYNGEIDRWKRAKQPKDIDNFVTSDATKIKWSSRLKETFTRLLYAEYDTAKIRTAVYRPFVKKLVFFDPILNHRQGRLPSFLPSPASEADNRMIIVGGYGRKPFSVFVTGFFPDLNFYADPAQCFPFYVFDEDGSNRRENITDWALKHFRDHYKNQAISKWDIFYYVYGMLHLPIYRELFAQDLKMELPRIPMAADFSGLADAGKRLATLHLDYEKVEPWDLEWVHAEGKPLSFFVEKMRLDKDKTTLRINESLSLAKIPPVAFDYRLGNRMPLEWVIDQYQVSEDKQSGITSDPNRPDDEEYIVRLVGQVVRVSVETVKIVSELSATVSLPEA